MAAHNELGQWGEQVAADHLERLGYTIRDRRWRVGHKDLDLVAISPDGTELVFVEVKTRSTEELLAPEEAVNKKKMRNLAQAADRYIKEYGLEMYARFDILTIVGTAPSNARIDHIEHAFNPLLLM